MQQEEEEEVDGSVADEVVGKAQIDGDDTLEKADGWFRGRRAR